MLYTGNGKIQMWGIDSLKLTVRVYHTITLSFELYRIYSM